LKICDKSYGNKYGKKKGERKICLMMKLIIAGMDGMLLENPVNFRVLLKLPATRQFHGI